jgi:hypothetical protein
MLTAGSRLLTAAVMPRILQDAVMIELRVLGSLRLSAPDREDVASLTRQPRRAALLAYLAAATPRGSHRRDKLLALFWPEQGFVAAAVTVSPSFRVGNRRVLFDDRQYLTHAYGAAYDVLPDGQRFLMIRRGSESPQVVVVLNWLEQLRGPLVISR